MWFRLRFGLFLGLAWALSLLPSITLAQSYVFGRADFGTGKEPLSLALGDFNGDGKPDLVVPNRSDNTVSVLLGKPDGTFSSKVDYATGPYPYSVVTGDFNGDGALDIAVTNENCTPIPKTMDFNCGAGSVSILIGNGDGTFQRSLQYAVGTRPISVVVGDFAGNGKLDLAVVNILDNTISILSGNGDGTFQSQVVYATADTPQSIIAADFNGDGKVDLAVGTNLQVSIFLAKGDGTFQSRVDATIGVASGAALTAGDFNGDGKLDLAVTGNYHSLNAVDILLGNGDGTFVINGSYLTGANPVAVVSADFNGDGKVDLVIANQNEDSFSILLGNGDGTFQPKADYGIGVLPSSLVVSDFNGDGQLDVAVVNSTCSEGTCWEPGADEVGSISVLLGLGNGSFVGRTSYATGVGTGLTTSADFNADGKLDLAVVEGTNTLAILLGNGDGTFQPQTSYSTGQGPVWIVPGDFNGDGKMDLAVVNETCSNVPCGPGSVSILLGNGDGTFRPHVDYPVGLTPTSLAIGDFNGDGKLDLAVTNNGSNSGNTVSILLGSGDGTFKPHVDYITATAPTTLTTGDFNKDGKVDLAVGAGAFVSILLGNGDGTFKAHVDYPVAGGPASIVGGDFNADGNDDLAIGMVNPAVVSILLGNGDGTFRPHVDYSYGIISPGEVNVGDFNGDGKIDLAVGIQSSSRAAILLGNGDGTFRSPVNYLATSTALSSMTLGDFNGDGGLDWAVADADTWTVSVTLNLPFKAVFPAALAVGSQGLGTTGIAQTITLSNPSGTPFTIGSINASGDYSQTNSCGANLLPAANCTINVRFSPSAAGVRSGAITITDSTHASPQVIPLTGTGINGPFLDLSPTKLQFGPKNVGSTSVSKTVVLNNSGNAPVSITNITITGANSTDFGQSNTCGNSLAVSTSCTITVTFMPSSGGTRTGSLTITDNAIGSPHLVSLSGNGSDFTLAAATGGSTSATVAPGGTATYNLQIAQVNGFTGTVTLACTGAPSLSTCTVSPASVSLGASASPFTVSVSTMAPSFVIPGNGTRRYTPPPLLYPFAFAMALLFLVFCALRMQSGMGKRALVCSFLILLFTGFWVAGCGGGSSAPTKPTNPGTPANTYTLTVTGTSNGVSHPLTISLTVN